MNKVRQTQSTNWKNKDLINFYERVPVKTMREYALIGGIESGIDIELIYPYICNADSICEIGAGYGRVLHYLVEQNYPGKITAIERSQQFFAYLQQFYAQHVTLIQDDIMECYYPHTFDVALWMWSNLSEWPAHEQLACLKKLIGWVKPGGLFVMETFDAEQTPLNSNYYEGQSYCHTGEYGTTYGYNANHKEINDYLTYLNAKRIKHIHYTTETGRKRSIDLLRC